MWLSRVFRTTCFLRKWASMERDLRPDRPIFQKLGYFSATIQVARFRSRFSEPI